MYCNKIISKIFIVGILMLVTNVTLSAKDKTDTDKISIIEEKTGISAKANRTLASLYDEAVEWLKTPYRRGGMSHKGMDCSGLASTIYKNVFDIKLQRRSRDISQIDVKDISKEELKPGDLVFFATSRRAKGVNHVGVYLGNKQFVHASVSNGVIVSSLDEGYYQRTWVKGGRPKTNTEAFENLFAKNNIKLNLELEEVVNQPLLINDVVPSKNIEDVKALDYKHLNIF